MGRSESASHHTRRDSEWSLGFFCFIFIARLSKYAKVVSKLAKITFESHFYLEIYILFLTFAESKKNSDLNICYLGDLNKFSCGT